MPGASDHYLAAEQLLNECEELMSTGLDEDQEADVALKLQAANVHAQLAQADLLRQQINNMTK